MNNQEIKYIAELIKGIIRENQVSLSIKDAVRDEKNNYTIDGKDIKDVKPIVQPSGENSGKGSMIILDNNYYLYLEHLKFFTELKTTLTKIDELMGAIAGSK
ncbi:MAG: hypothetical protein FWE18_04500 [Alphaproteobacteria bacterium]|nr:hypothetical protein [Alphaproteobacteria bacterium]